MSAGFVPVGTQSALLSQRDDVMLSVVRITGFAGIITRPGLMSESRRSNHEHRSHGQHKRCSQLPHKSSPPLLYYLYAQQPRIDRQIYTTKPVERIAKKQERTNKVL